MYFRMQLVSYNAAHFDRTKAQLIDIELMLSELYQNAHSRL